MLLDGVAVAVPRLLQFLGTSTTLSFSAVRLAFHNNFADLLAFQLGERRASFRVQIMCRHLDWQVSFTIQILTALRPVPSVEQPTLSHVEHYRSPEWHIKVDRTQWRQLLRPFTNLKTSCPKRPCQQTCSFSTNGRWRGKCGGITFPGHFSSTRWIGTFVLPTSPALFQ